MIVALGGRVTSKARTESLLLVVQVKGSVSPDVDDLVAASVADRHGVRVRKCRGFAIAGRTGFLTPFNPTCRGLYAISGLGTYLISLRDQ